VETVRQFVTVVARIIAAIFAFFFVITTVLSILITALNGQIFNASLYKNALVEQNIYARMPEIVGAAITSSYSNDLCTQNQLACSMDGASPGLQACLTTALGTDAFKAIGSGSRSPTQPELMLAQPCLDQYGSRQAPGNLLGESSNGIPAVMQNLTTGDWQALLSILLPPDTLKAMTESTLDQVFAYINGGAESVFIPMDSLKQRLLSPSGAALFLQVLNLQPPCNEQDISQLLTGTSTGGLVFCKPPEDILPLIKVVLPELLKAIVPQIPDKVFIIQPPATGTFIPGSGPFGSDPISTLRTVRLLMRLSLIIPILFLLIITVFAVRNIKSWMRWWGIPFLVAGIISVGLGIAIVPAFNIAWTWFIASQIPVFIPSVLPEIGQELLSSILKTLSSWIIIPGIVLGAIGLSAWIGSFYLKDKQGPGHPPAKASPTS
jgi:hypothetical protein